MAMGGNGEAGVRAPAAWLPFVAAALFTLIAVVGVSKVYRLQADLQREALRSDLVTRLGVIRARLESNLTAPLLISRGLVSQIIFHEGMGNDEFMHSAELLIQDYPAIRNLTLARGTAIAAVYPYEPNKAAIGTDYRDRPDQWGTVERALKSRRPVVAGPVDLVQGGTALIGRVPVFMPIRDGGEARLYGLVSVVINIPVVFSASGLVDPDNLPFRAALRGRDGMGRAGAMIWGDEAVFSASPVEMEVSLPDGKWLMAAVPRRGWEVDDGQLRMTALMGTAVAALCAVLSFGLAVYALLRRRSLVHLAESEERYRALMETAPVAVVLHSDGVVLFANTEAGRMVHAPPGESPVGRPVLDFVHSDSRELVAARTRDLLAAPEGAGKVMGGPVRYMTFDGLVIDTEVVSTRITLAGRPAILSVVRDVTERRRAEEERERLLDSLRRSNEDLQQFAYIASHDLQEPLRNVAGYVQLLGRRYRGRLDPDADTFIDYAVRGTKRMQELIGDLLEYSRLQPEGSPPPTIPSRDALEDALHDLETAIDESGALIEVEGEMPQVAAWPRELSRIFVNLIGNAVKYRVPGQLPRIRVSVRRHDNEWIFSVSDNGIGIEASYQERIFTMFNRLHSRDVYEGTGIGLAICRKLVQHNGGRIWVESNPGEGSTFRFSLPIPE